MEIEELPGCFDSRQTVCAESLVATVVEENVGCVS